MLCFNQSICICSSLYFVYELVVVSDTCDPLPNPLGISKFLNYFVIKALHNHYSLHLSQK